MMILRGQQRCLDASQIISSYEYNRKSVAEAIRQEFSSASSEDMGNVPEEIAKLACDIAVTCGIERCRLHLTAPRNGVSVSKEDQVRGKIQVRNAQSNINNVNTTVNLVISPGLEKSGLGDDAVQAFDGASMNLFPAHVLTLP
jgi:hypothetical protein